MSKWIEHLTKTQGRITTGCVLALSIAVGLSPDYSQSFDPGKFAAIIVAAIAWLYAELAGHRAPSAHDVTLFKGIVQALPHRLITFLREQDFGVGVYADVGSCSLGEVAHWDGARYTFVDKNIEKRWVELRRNIGEFSFYLAMNTFPVSAGQQTRTVHPTLGDPDCPERFISDRIDKLNNDATKIADQIDEFENYTRRRLGL